MRFEIVFSPEAVQDLKRLDAHARSKVKDRIELHLRFEPGKVSKSRIKRLRGLKKPQYRLRVEEYRIYYDILDDTIEILAIISKSEQDDWLSQFGENAMKRVPLSEIKDHLSEYLRASETEQIIITRHGRPAGILIGFKDEEEWFEWRLENDPRFLDRIEKSRRSLRQGKGVKLEDLAD